MRTGAVAPQFALGGLAAPLVGLDGTRSAAPMAWAVVSFSTAGLLVYALSVLKAGAQEPE
ncbi:hypothetical protein [Streptomyces sp. RPT161]|uniref:hypothetical protein n=1 Tax=Streptomyces sp. RPT161 TaxID=3015993 RepID=UPI0022B892DB|nr:hypothetical protein [Streptomyces sp. RPT161]